MNTEQISKSKYANDIRESVFTMNSLRRNSQNPVDISMQEFVQARWGISMETFYADLGLNASIDTIQNIFTTPSESVRWLIPEIFRDALRLGLRKAPIWNDLIAAEQTIAQPQITLPHINMSDATPRYVGEAETIPQGTLSYGSKTLKVRKMGKGIKIPYEVAQYVTINVVAIFLQDFGVKLNHGIDSLMIDCLINGEQLDGSESAPVIGVGTVNMMKYRDLLKVWVRMSRIGRSASSMIGGEESAIDTLDLDEFKIRTQGATEKTLNLKTPIPAGSDYFIHGSMDPDETLVVDRTSAIIKYNAQPLLVEEDKIVSKQVLETYASLTTGFGILYRDARVIIDKSLDFATNGFPAYMDVDPLEQVTITD